MIKTHNVHDTLNKAN